MDAKFSFIKTKDDEQSHPGDVHLESSCDTIDEWLSRKRRSVRNEDDEKSKTTSAKPIS